MKIRILANSIRYRLTISEVKMLGEKKFIEDQTGFQSSMLQYRIEQYDGQQLKVDYVSNCITLRIPSTMVDALCNTEIVGFEEKSGPVSILIEKDFVCLDNSTEDQSDHYPNPNMAC